MKNFRSVRGATFVEVMVATVLMSLFISGTIAFFKNLGDNSLSIRTVDRAHKEVYNIVESLRSNLSKYQIDFKPTPLETFSPDDVAELATNELPYAWSKSGISSVENCSNCPGRMGYIVKPVEHFSGLYYVTVRLTNTDLFEGPRDFVFLATMR